MRNRQARITYRKNWPYLAATLVAWLAYAALTFFAPVHANIYHVSYFEIILLQLTIILPLLAIWLVAANGGASFKHYGGLIRHGEDGRGLDTVSTGLLLVVVFFILQALLGSIPQYLVGSPYLQPMVMVSNQVPLLIALIAFAFIFVGAIQLRRLSVRRLTVQGLVTILFPYCLLAIIFAWVFYSQLPQATPATGIPKFAVPGKWPFYTLALPYIVTWLLGILSITMIAEYARTVGGSIYRRALKSLVRGITATLAYSILLQLLELSSGLFAKWTLGPILVLLYALLILYSVGFLFIARGAGKLTLIEITQ